MPTRDDIRAAVIAQASQLTGQELDPLTHEPVHVHLDPTQRVNLIQILPSLIEKHVNQRDLNSEASLRFDRDVSFDDVIHYASYLAGNESFPLPPKK